jgi:hypothetical protein
LAFGKPEFDTGRCCRGHLLEPSPGKGTIKKRAEARFLLSDLAELGFFAEFLFCIGPLVVLVAIKLLAVRISRKNVKRQADEGGGDHTNENFTHRNSNIINFTNLSFWTS